MCEGGGWGKDVCLWEWVYGGWGDVWGGGCVGSGGGGGMWGVVRIDTRVGEVLRLCVLFREQSGESGRRVLGTDGARFDEGL